MEKTIPHNQPPHKRRPLKLTEAQKKGLINGSLTLGSVLAGAALYSLFGNSVFSPEEHLAAEDMCTPEEEELTPTVSSPDGGNTQNESAIPEPEHIADRAMIMNDEMSFGEAFSTARQSLGSGGVFEWRGELYNTFYHEEWEAMSKADQESFVLHALQNNTLKTVEQSTAHTTNTDGTTDDVEAMMTAADDPVDGDALAVAEPVIGTADFNNDGLVDAIAVDEDMDHYADTIIVDRTANGVPDAILYDSDDNTTLDVIIVDENEDGFEDDKIQYDDLTIDMDEFDIDNDTSGLL